MTTDTLTNIRCFCGRRLFNLRASATGRMHSRTMCIRTIRIVLVCPHCNRKTPPFTASLLIPTFSEFYPGIDRIKYLITLIKATITGGDQMQCPDCKGTLFKASVLHINEGLFGASDFCHELKCANPKCHWKVRSTAESIFSKE